MTLAECIVGLATGFLDLNVFQSREYYNVWGMVALPVVQYLVVLIDTKLSQSAERKRDSDSLLGGNDCAPGVFTLP